MCVYVYVCICTYRNDFNIIKGSYIVLDHQLSYTAYILS